MSFLQKIMGKNSKKDKSKGKKMAPQKGLKEATTLASALATPSAAVSAPPQVAAQPNPPPKKPEAQASVATVVPTTTTPPAPSPKLKGKKSHVLPSASTSQVTDNMSSQSPKEPNQAFAASLVQDSPPTAKPRVENQGTVLLNPATIIPDALTEIPENRSSLNKSGVTLLMRNSASSSNSEGEKGVKCQTDFSQKSKEVPVVTKNKSGRVSKPTQQSNDSQQGTEEKPKDVQVADKPKALLTIESRELPKQSTNATQTATGIRLDTKNVEVARVTKSSTHVSSWLHDKLILETQAMSLAVPLPGPLPKEALKTQAGGSNAQDDSLGEVSVICASEGIEHKEASNVSHPKESIPPQKSDSCYGMIKTEKTAETAEDRNPSSSFGPVIVQKIEESEPLVDKSKQSSPGCATTSKRLSDTLWTALETFEQQIHQDKTSQEMLASISKQKESAEEDHKTRREQTENVDPASAPITTIQLTPELGEVPVINTENRLQQPLGIEPEHKNKAYQVSVGPGFEAKSSITHDESKNKGNKTQLKGKATPLYTSQATTQASRANAQEEASSFKENDHKTLNDDRGPEVAITVVKEQQEYQHINLLHPEDHIIQERLSRELGEQQNVLQEPKFADVVVHSQYESPQEEQKLNILRESLEREQQKDKDERPEEETIKQANFAQELNSGNNTTAADEIKNESLKSEQKVNCNDIDENTSMKPCQLEKELESTISTGTAADKTKAENIMSEQEVSLNDRDEITSKSPGRLESAIPTEVTLSAISMNEEKTSTRVKDNLQEILPTDVFPLRDDTFQELDNTKSLEVGPQEPGKVTTILSPDKDKPAVTDPPTIAEEEHKPLDGESAYRKELVVTDGAICQQEVYQVLEFHQVQEQENSTTPATLELEVHADQVSDNSLCEGNAILGPDQTMQKQECNSQDPPHSAIQDSVSIKVDQHMSKDALEPDGVATISQHQHIGASQLGIMDEPVQDGGLAQEPQAADLEPTPWALRLHSSQNQAPIHQEQTSHTVDGQNLELEELNTTDRKTVTDEGRNGGKEQHLPNPTETTFRGQETLPLGPAAIVDEDHQCMHKEIKNNFPSLDATERVYEIQEADMRNPSIEQASQEVQFKELTKSPMKQASVPQVDDERLQVSSHLQYNTWEDNSLEKDSVQEPEHGNLQDKPCEQEQILMPDEDRFDANCHEIEQEIKQRPEDIKLDQEPLTHESNGSTLPDHNVEDVADKVADTTVNFGVIEQIDRFEEIEADLKQKESVNENPLPETKMFSDFDDLCTEAVQDVDTQAAISTSAVNTSMDATLEENQEDPRIEVAHVPHAEQEAAPNSTDKQPTTAVDEHNHAVIEIDPENAGESKEVHPDTENLAGESGSFQLRKPDVITTGVKSKVSAEVAITEQRHIAEDGLQKPEVTEVALNKKPENHGDESEKDHADSMIQEPAVTDVTIPDDAGQEMDATLGLHNEEAKELKETEIQQVPCSPKVQSEQEVKLVNSMDNQEQKIEDLNKIDVHERTDQVQLVYHHTKQPVNNEETMHSIDQCQTTAHHTDSSCITEEKQACLDGKSKDAKSKEQEPQMADAAVMKEPTSDRIDITQAPEDVDIREGVSSDTGGVTKVQIGEVNEHKSDEEELQLTNATVKKEPTCERIEIKQALKEEVSLSIDEQRETICEPGLVEVQTGNVNEYEPKEQVLHRTDTAVEREPTNDRTEITQASKDITIREEASFEIDEWTDAKCGPEFRGVHGCESQEQELQMTVGAAEKEPASDTIQTTQASQDIDIREQVSSNIDEEREAIVEPGEASKDAIREEASLEMDEQRAKPEIAEVQIGGLKEYKSAEQKPQMTDAAAEKEAKNDRIEIMQASQDIGIREEVPSNIDEQREAIVELREASKDVTLREEAPFETDEQKEAICEPEIAEGQIGGVNGCESEERELQMTDPAAEKEPTSDKIGITQVPQDIDIRQELSSSIDEHGEAIVEPGVAEIQIGQVNEYNSNGQELQATNAAGEKEQTSESIEIEQASKDTDSIEEVSFRIEEQKEGICEPGVAEVQTGDVNEHKPKEQMLQRSDTAVEKESTNDRTEIIQVPKDITIREEASFEFDEQREAICEPKIDEVQIGGVTECKSNKLELQMQDAAAEKEQTSEEIEITQAPEDIDIREEVSTICEPGVAQIQLGDVKQYKSEEQVLRTTDAAVEKQATSDRIEITQAPEDTDIKEEVLLKAHEQREAVCETDVAEVVEMDGSQQPDVAEPDVTEVVDMDGSQQPDDELECGQNISTLDNKKPLAQTNKQEVGIEEVHETDVQDEPDSKIAVDDQKTNVCELKVPNSQEHDTAVKAHSFDDQSHPDIHQLQHINDQPTLTEQKQEYRELSSDQIIGSDIQEQAIDNINEQINDIHKLEGTIPHLQDKGQNFDIIDKSDENIQKNEVHEQETEQEKTTYNLEQIENSTTPTQQSLVQDEESKIEELKDDAAAVKMVTESSTLLTEISSSIGQITFGTKNDVPADLEIEEQPSPDMEENTDEVNQIEVVPEADEQRKLCNETDSLSNSVVEEKASIDAVDQNKNVQEVEVTNVLFTSVAEGQGIDVRSLSIQEQNTTQGSDENVSTEQRTKELQFAQILTLPEEQKQTSRALDAHFNGLQIVEETNEQVEIPEANNIGQKQWSSVVCDQSINLENVEQFDKQVETDKTADADNESSDVWNLEVPDVSSHSHHEGQELNATNLSKEENCEETKLQEQWYKEPQGNQSAIPPTEKEQSSGAVEIQDNELEEVQSTNAEVENSQTSIRDEQKNGDPYMEADNICNSSLLAEESDHEKHAKEQVSTEAIQTCQSIGECNDQVQEPEGLNDIAMQNKTLDEHEETETDEQSVQRPECKQNTSAVNEESSGVEKDNEEMQAGAQHKDNLKASQDEAECEALTIELEGNSANRACDILSEDGAPLKMSEKSTEGTICVTAEDAVIDVEECQKSIEEAVCVKAEDAVIDVKECQDEANKKNPTHGIVESKQECQEKEPDQANTGAVIDEQVTDKIEQESCMQKAEEVSQQQEEKLQRIDQTTLTREEQQKNEMQEYKEPTFEQEQRIEAVYINAPIVIPFTRDDQKIESGELMNNEVDEQQDAIKELELNKDQAEAFYEKNVPAEIVFHGLDATPTKADNDAQTEEPTVAEEVHVCDQRALEKSHGSGEILIETHDRAPLEEPSCTKEAHTSQEVEIYNSGTERISIESFLEEHEDRRLEATGQSMDAEKEKGEQQEHQIATDLLRSQQVQGCEEVDVNEQAAKVQHLEVNRDQAESITEFSQIVDGDTFDILSNEGERGPDKGLDATQEPNDKKEGTEQSQESNEVPPHEAFTEPGVGEPVTTLNEARDGVQESENLLEVNKEGFKDATQEPNDKEEATEQNQGGYEVPSDEAFTQPRVDEQVTTLNEARDGVQEITGALLEADKEGFKDATQEPNDKEEATEENQGGYEVPSDEVFTEDKAEEQVATLNEERDGIHESETTGDPLEADKYGFKDATQEPTDKEKATEQNQATDKLPSEEVFTETKVEEQIITLAADKDGFKDATWKPNDKDEAADKNQGGDEVPSDEVFTEPKVDEQVTTLNKERDGTQEIEITRVTLEENKERFKDATPELNEKEEATEKNQGGGEVPSDEVFTEPKVEEQVTTLNKERDGTQESEIPGAPLVADKDRFKDAIHEPNDKEETTEKNQGDEVPPYGVFIEPKAEEQITTLNEERDCTQEREMPGAPFEADKEGCKDATQEPNNNKEATEKNRGGVEVPSDGVFTKPKVEEQVTTLDKERDSTQESEIPGAPLVADKDRFKDAAIHEPNDKEDTTEKNQGEEVPPYGVFIEPKVEEQITTLNEKEECTQEREIPGVPLEADKEGCKDATQEPNDNKEATEKKRGGVDVPSDGVFTEPKVEEQVTTPSEERDGEQEIEITKAPLEADKDRFNDATQEPNEKVEAAEQNQERDEVTSDEVFTEPKVEEQVTTLNKERDGTKETEIMGEEINVNKQEEKSQHPKVNPDQAESSIKDETAFDTLPNEAERGRILMKAIITPAEEQVTSDRDEFKHAMQEPNHQEEATKQNQERDEVPSDEVFTEPKVEEYVTTPDEARVATRETEITGALLEADRENQEKDISVTEAQQKTGKIGEMHTEAPELSGNQEEKNVSTGDTYMSRQVAEVNNFEEKEEAVNDAVEVKEENHEEIREDPIVPKHEEQTLVQVTEGIEVIDVSISAEGPAAFESQLKTYPSESESDLLVSTDKDCLLKHAEECKHSTLEEHSGRQEEETFGLSSLSEDSSSANSIKAQTIVVAEKSAGATSTNRQLESDIGEPQAKSVALEKENECQEEKCDQVHVHEEDTSHVVGKHQNDIEEVEVANKPLNVETHMDDMHKMEVSNIALEATESDKEGIEGDDIYKLKGQEEKTKLVEVDIERDDIAERDGTEELKEVEETLKIEATNSIAVAKDRDDTEKRHDIEELQGPEKTLQVETRDGSKELEGAEDALKLEATDSIEVDIKRDDTEDLEAAEKSLLPEATGSIEMDTRRDNRERRDDIEELEGPEKTLQIETRDRSKELEGAEDALKLEAPDSIEVDIKRDDTEDLEAAEKSLQLEATGSIEVDTQRDDTGKKDGTEELKRAEEALKITSIEVYIERDDTEELKKSEKTLQLETTDSFEVDIERDDTKKSDGTEKLKESEETLKLETTESIEVTIEGGNTEESDDTEELKGPEKTFQFEAADSIEVDIKTNATEKEPKGAEETLGLEATNSIKVDIERDDIQELKGADEETDGKEHKQNFEEKSATLGDGQEHFNYADEQNNELQQIDKVSVPLDVMVTDASLAAIGQIDELKDLDGKEVEPKKADLDLMCEQEINKTTERTDAKTKETSLEKECEQNTTIVQEAAPSSEGERHLQELEKANMIEHEIVQADSLCNTMIEQRQVSISNQIETTKSQEAVPTIQDNQIAAEKEQQVQLTELSQESQKFESGQEFITKKSQEKAEGSELEENPGEQQGLKLRDVPLTLGQGKLEIESEQIFEHRCDMACEQPITALESAEVPAPSTQEREHSTDVQKESQELKTEGIRTGMDAQSDELQKFDLANIPPTELQKQESSLVDRGQGPEDVNSMDLYTKAPCPVDGSEEPNDETSLRENQSGQELECQKITPLPVHEEQPYSDAQEEKPAVKELEVKAEHQMSCTKQEDERATCKGIEQALDVSENMQINEQTAQNIDEDFVEGTDIYVNTSNVGLRELAPTEDESAQNKKVLLEVLGEPNQKVLEVTEDSESHTGIHVPMAEQKDTVQMHNEQSYATESENGIDTRVASILFTVKQQESVAVTEAEIENDRRVASMLLTVEQQESTAVTKVVDTRVASIILTVEQQESIAGIDTRVASILLTVEHQESTAVTEAESETQILKEPVAAFEGPKDETPKLEEPAMTTAEAFIVGNEASRVVHEEEQMQISKVAGAGPNEQDVMLVAIKVDDVAIELPPSTYIEKQEKEVEDPTVYVIQGPDQMPRQADVKIPEELPKTAREYYAPLNIIEDEAELQVHSMTMELQQGCFKMESTQLSADNAKFSGRQKDGVDAAAQELEVKFGDSSQYKEQSTHEADQLQKEVFKSLLQAAQPTTRLTTEQFAPSFYSKDTEQTSGNNPNGARQ